jgi:hypothetical protein
MKKLIVVVGAIRVLVLVALTMAFPTMWLWNWLMPTLFGIVKVTFWQALGVNLLTGVLFRSYNSKSSS